MDTTYSLGTYLKGTDAAQALFIHAKDLRRHLDIVGSSGYGKTTLIYKLTSQLPAFAFIDGEGDAARTIADSTPCLYFRASDYSFPWSINILQDCPPDERDERTAQVVEMFSDIWGLGEHTPRVVEYLNAGVRLLLESQLSTLADLPRLYVDDTFRAYFLKKCRHKQTREFWADFQERCDSDKKFRGQDTASTLNKVRALTRSLPLRLILGQSTSTIRFRRLMDDGSVKMVFDLSGIGEQDKRLIGAVIISQINIAARSREDTEHANFPDFPLIIDEFRDFASRTMPGILSKSRKRRLNVILAHQHFSQLDKEIVDSILGNVSSLIVFKVGNEDAVRLGAEMGISPDALQFQSTGNAWTRILHNGVSLRPLPIATDEPMLETAHLEGNIANTRSRYCHIRKDVEYALDWYDRLKWARGWGTEKPTSKTSRK